MDACPVMETDGGRTLRNLLSLLVIIYAGAIDASDNPTLSSRSVVTPETFVPYRMQLLGAPLRTSNNLHQKIMDDRNERVA